METTYCSSNFIYPWGYLPLSYCRLRKATVTGITKEMFTTGNFVLGGYELAVPPGAHDGIVVVEG